MSNLAKRLDKFDPQNRFVESDFDWLIGLKVNNARKLLASFDNVLTNNPKFTGQYKLYIRVVSKGSKRYPVSLEYYNCRLNVAISRWNRRITRVEGTY